MRCIIYQSPPFSILSEQICKRQRIVWPAKKQQTIQENWSVFSSSSSVKTRAAVSPVFIATSSAATGGSISVLLQTSAVLLFAYWIANFVVPSFIIKDLQKDDSSENGDNSSDD